MKLCLPYLLIAALASDAFTVSPASSRRTSLKAATLVEEEIDFDGEFDDPKEFGFCRHAATFLFFPFVIVWSC